MTDTIERVTDETEAAEMLRGMQRLDAYMRRTADSPANAVAIAMLYIAHVHRHWPEDLQLKTEDLIAHYLTDMRTRRELWQSQRT